MARSTWRWPWVGALGLAAFAAWWLPVFAGRGFLLLNVITLFREIQREGRTVVVVTHDPEVAKTAERHHRDPGRPGTRPGRGREREAGGVRA